MHDSASKKPLELVKITKVTSSEEPEKQPENPPKRSPFPINEHLRPGARIVTISDDKKRDELIRAEFLAARYERDRLKRAA